MGTYNKYAPVDAPWKRFQIRRNGVAFIPSSELTPLHYCFFIKNEVGIQNEHAQR
jgi:hypothetical protein